MGAWGKGVYENDGALDLRSSLVEPVTKELERSPAHLVTGFGLLMWLETYELKRHAERLAALLRSKDAWLRQVPLGVREQLERAVEKPAELDSRGEDHPPDVAYALGNGKAGVFAPELFAFPGASEVVAGLVASAVAVLDEAERHGAEVGDGSLYQLSDPLGALGLLLELLPCGGRVPRIKVAEWRAVVERANAQTGDEREFWDAYVARVRKGLDLLERACD